MHNIGHTCSGKVIGQLNGYAFAKGVLATYFCPMVLWQERSKHGGQNDNDQLTQSGLMFSLRHILNADNDHCSSLLVSNA